MAAKFVRRLRLRAGELGGSQSIPVEIVPMTPELVATWQRFVQPKIDDHYRLAHSTDTSVDAGISRADVGWNWHIWLGLAWLQSLTRAKAAAMCIVIRPKVGRVLPIGMVISVPQFVARVDQIQAERNFVWFCAAAPHEFFKEILPVASRVSGLSETLLDTAIVAAIRAGASPQTLLHASKDGGEKLLKFYREKCRMKQLLPDSRPISWTRRSDLTNYFYFDRDGATSFATQFDSLR